MKFLLGRLRLPPDAAWRTTMSELAYATQGYGEHYGANSDGPTIETHGMTRERLAELKRQFPDT